jgi:hypothetical protein
VIADEPHLSLKPVQPLPVFATTMDASVTPLHNGAPNF